MPASHVSTRIARRAGAAAGLAAALAVLPQAHAATNLFNVYVGAAYARSNLRAHDSTPLPFSGSGPLNSFSRSASGYQLSLGVRALEMLGGEVDYFDLGSGSVQNPYTSSFAGSVVDASVAQKGEAAFAMLYLPVPVVDIYVKAGVDRINSDLNGQFAGPASCPLTGCTTEPLGLHKTTTGLAFGAGAQWQFGNWGLRAEYERFTAYGGHPDLVSLGVVWTFL
ncbi:MAG: outer membrane beta-barrel protein [Pseudomonadota bacterium]|jgi:opacity protein-like surface antigen|nr:outer membrane beta-barrel protein [Pseudomonadota bacterium]